MRRNATVPAVLVEIPVLPVLPVLMPVEIPVLPVQVKVEARVKVEAHVKLEVPAPLPSRSQENVQFGDYDCAVFNIRRTPAFADSNALVMTIHRA